MRHRVIEILKDIVIAVLTLAILLLILLALPTKTIQSTPWLSALVKPVAGLFGMNAAELTYVQTAVPAPSAAQPLAISVQNLAGRCSAIYDEAALDQMHETLGALLAQALDGAQDAEETTQQALLEALRAPSVAFTYSSALRADVLAAWLNATCGLTDEARWFVLSAQEDGVSLYLVSNEVTVIKSALSQQALLDAIESYAPDGSRFAFEAGESYARVGALSLLPAASPTLYAAQAENPCDQRFTTNLAAELGFNPYAETSYTDAAGNTTYNETDCTLRVSQTGEVTLRTAAGETARYQAEQQTALAQIEAARALLWRITSQMATEGQLYLSGYEQTEQGAVCSFDYVLGGVVVQQQTGAAARVEFTGSDITLLHVTLRSYTRSEEQLTLLPAAQAAAIIPDGALLSVCYADSQGTSLTAGWRS